MEGRLCRRIELLYPSDASDDPPGGVDLVLDMTGSFVDEGRSEGRISSELERAATHCGVMEGTNKGGMVLVYLSMARNRVRYGTACAMICTYWDDGVVELE